jgi:hypothetical protein
MTKNELQIIKKYWKLRSIDPKGTARVAVQLYNSLDERDRDRMIKEFQDYIIKVEHDIIKPSPVVLKIPRFKLN